MTENLFRGLVKSSNSKRLANTSHIDIVMKYIIEHPLGSSLEELRDLSFYFGNRYAVLHDTLQFCLKHNLIKMIKNRQNRFVYFNLPRNSPFEREVKNSLLKSETLPQGLNIEMTSDLEKKR